MNVGKRLSIFSCTASKKDKILIILTTFLLIPLSGMAQTELTLAEAIERGLSYSPLIKASRSALTAAEKDLKTAGSLRWPTLSLDGKAYYFDDVPEADIEFGPVNQTMKLGVTDNYQFDFKLSVPLYTGGKIGSQVEISRAGLDAQKYRFESDKLKAAYNIRQTYLQLMLANATMGASMASLSRIGIIRNNVYSLHENGLADSLDILEAELAYQKALQSVEEIRTVRSNAMTALAVQLGMNDEQSIVPSEKLSMPDSATIEQEITVQNLERPELKASRSFIDISRRKIKLSRADYFPNISGYGGYSVGKPNRNFFENEWNDYFVAGLVLTWNFNLGMQTSHRVTSAEYSLQKAEYEKSVLEDALLTGARTASENVFSAYRKLKISETELDIARRRFNLAKSKHEEGLLSTNRYLEMEAELSSAEQLYQASLANYYLAETEYFYSAGSSKIYGGL